MPSSNAGYFYFYRGGDITAGNTSTALTGQGSNSSPGAITVPANSQGWLVSVEASFGVLLGATTVNTWGTLFLRFSGNSLVSSEQDICIGGITELFTTSGGNSGEIIVMPIPVYISLIPNNLLNINAELENGALGASAKVHVGVTVVIQ